MALGNVKRLFIHLATMGNHDYLNLAGDVLDAIDDTPVSNSVTQIAGPFAFQALDVVPYTRGGFQAAETARELQGQRPIGRCEKLIRRGRQDDLKHRLERFAN